MRLAYLCHDPVPGLESRVEQLVLAMAALAPHGVETTLVVPRTGAPGATAAARMDEIRRVYGVDPGSGFPAGLLELPARPGPDRRLGRLLLDARAVRAARAGPWDLVYTRDLRALLLALAAGLPCVFETFRRDLNRQLRFWPFRRLAYPRSNLRGLVVHSAYALRAFRAAGLEDERLHLAYNGWEPRSLLPVRSREEARRELGLGPGPFVVYAGHVQAYKGLSSLLEVAARARGATFLLVGAVPGSAGERAVAGEVLRRGLANVRLVPRVPPHALAPWLYCADCLVVPPTAEPLVRHGKTVLPMKIFPYLASGRPILAPRLPDVEEVLRDGENALLVAPDRPDEAARALARLLVDGELARRLGERGRAEARAYTWEARAARLAPFLRACLARRAA